MKLEHCSFLEQLHNEKEVYEELQRRNGGSQMKGFPMIQWFGQEGNLNVLAMDMLGLSLEALFNSCGRRFTYKTTLLIGCEVLDRLQTLHACGYVHRDLKPQNLLIGSLDHKHLVHLIDFGMAQRFADLITGKHLRYHDGFDMLGTACYASINAHRGVTQTRRDDLISLSYILMYFLRGSLPWSEHTASSKPGANARLAKAKAKVPRLYKDLPSELTTVVDYAARLAFDETPDYDYIRNMFELGLIRNGFHRSSKYDREMSPAELGHRVYVCLAIIVHKTRN
ncbi:kinase-like domain-containing protein [Rhodofomes roseus]|uniref:non-specific serine/threonine protein kinase n=1 Tax=Rhodofomes roseus TaxID=34475 RepID=A0ABQ8KHU7_9APHY|nr:kinase-like domain-containing protein [Rhodofomes roseus]KAH9837529.1 kinase-like domain-containing protein [Rhodofomes roseus]